MKRRLIHNLRENELPVYWVGLREKALAESRNRFGQFKSVTRKTSIG